MGQAALQLSRETSRAHDALAVSFPPHLVLIEGGTRASRSRELLFLGCALVLLQVLDGLLTGIGMATFGPDMEGNFLLRRLMLTVGYIPALFITKSIAIWTIVFLCSQAGKIAWLRYALHGVCALYFAAAIVPWTYILAVAYLA